MKCKFILDVDVDVSTMPDDQKPKIKWKTTINRLTGEPRLEAYFPAGTEYEHDNAAFFVNHGMALPADAECEAAVKPMSPDQRKKVEQEYHAAVLGIADAKDKELFFAGVIAGYERLENGQLAYLPGPNYDAWKAAQDAAKAKSTSDV